MSKILTGKRLWETITKAVRETKPGQRQVAVAYLATGARQLLPLGRGDTLVVDCSRQTARAGQTNPTEVRRFVQAGVRVYHWAGLHAKVYVFRDVLIIGSPNVSTHSQKHLKEVALLVTEQSAVDQARGFVSSLTRQKVDEKWLSAREKEWVPPRAGTRGASQPETEALPPAQKAHGASKAALQREAARRGRQYALARFRTEEREVIRQEGALRGFRWALASLDDKQKAAVRQKAKRLGYKWAVEGWDHAKS